jgi:hypothetical protein
MLATVLRIRDVLSRIRIRPFSPPGSGTKHFFIPDPSYMKSGMQTYFFLASYASRGKVFVIVKKIRDLEKMPGSGSRIQDPWGKKAPDPDPQHWLEGVFILIFSSAFSNPNAILLFHNIQAHSNLYNTL